MARAAQKRCSIWATLRPSATGAMRSRLLVGDASKAREKLGWKPKTTFAQMVKEMVASDLDDQGGRPANGKPSV